MATAHPSSDRYAAPFVRGISRRRTLYGIVSILLRRRGVVATHASHCHYCCALESDDLVNHRRICHILPKEHQVVDGQIRNLATGLDLTAPADNPRSRDAKVRLLAAVDVPEFSELPGFAPTIIHSAAKNVPMKTLPAFGWLLRKPTKSWTGCTPHSRMSATSHANAATAASESKVAVHNAEAMWHQPFIERSVYTCGLKQ